MNTFTHEEEKLVLVIAACFLMATAVLLCCPEYDEKIAISSMEPVQKLHSPPPGASPVDTSRPDSRRISTKTQAVNLSNKLDPNFATYDELIALPGIGPSTAKALLSYREKHILFSPNDLKRIKGIGPAKLSKLKEFLVFSADSGGK